MIPLIDCSIRDSNNYYHGVVVIHNNEPVVFHERSEEGVVCTRVVNGDTSTTVIPYEELQSYIFPSFYTEQGEWVGITVRRSYKRGLEYSTTLLSDLRKILNNDSPRTKQRLSWNFFVKQHRGVSIVLHNGYPAGFVQDSVYCVTSSDIADRLTKLLDQLGEHDVSVRVV